MSPLTLSITDTCAVLGLSRTSIYKLINAAKLRTLKIGTRTLITMESIEALLEEAHS